MSNPLNDTSGLPSDSNQLPDNGLPPNKSGKFDTLVQKFENMLHQHSTSGILLAFAFCLLLMSLGSLFFGYRLGYYQGDTEATEKAKIVIDGEVVTPESVTNLQGKIKALEKQLSTAVQERDISLTSQDDLKTTNETLKVTNLQLTQNDEIFTKLLAKQGGIPLQIIGAKIAPLPENAFEYRFDVAMLDKSNQPKKLAVSLNLLDEQNVVEVPLDPASYDIHGIARIRGRFIMPQGFTPKQAKVSLAAGNEKIEQAYDWQLGKTIDNLPYSLAETPDADQKPLPADPDTQSLPSSASQTGELSQKEINAALKANVATANQKAGTTPPPKADKKAND